MDLITFVSWNIRGASNSTNRLNLREVVKESQADFLCVQETKIQNWSESAIKQLRVGLNSGWAAVPATGLSGGLLSVWNFEIFQLLKPD